MAKKIILDNIEKIIQECRTMKFQDIAKKYNIGRHALRKKINKIQRGKIQQDKRYTLFDKIDNEISSYWLGYMFADGCVHINEERHIYQVSLGSNDIEHVAKFYHNIGATNKMSIHKNHAKVFVCCKYLCNALINLGCTPRKSLTLRFPVEQQVPDNLLHHFIRGYYDGDGCVSCNLKGHKYSCGVLGTFEFLSSLRDKLKTKCDMSDKLIYTIKNNKAFNLTYASNSDLHKLFRYLYDDATIYLDRKYKKFLTIVNNTIDHTIPRFCSVDGCGKKYQAKGYCKNHYGQLYHA